MNQDQVIVLGFKVALIAGESAALLWLCVYTYLSRWWTSPLGGTVTRLVIYLAALYLVSILSLFVHFNRNTSRVAGWFDVAIFAIVAIELFRRVPTWVKLHLNKQGEHSYAGMMPFIRQVIQRRGRPVWMDEPAECEVPPDDAAPAGTTAG